MPLGRVRPLGMRHIIAALFCLLAVAGVQAQTPYPRPAGFEWWGTSVPNGTTGIEYTTSGAKLTGGPNGAGAFLGRNFGAQSNGAIPMMEKFRVPLGGSEIVVGAARVLSAAEIANGAAMLYGSWVAGQWVGSQIADYLDLGARVTPTTTGWQFDPGVDPGKAVCNGWPMNWTNPHSSTCSPQEWCNGYVKSQASGTGWLWRAALQGSGSGLTCVGSKSNDGGATYSEYWSATLGLGSVPVEQALGCRGYTDAFNAALSRPDGGAADPDGKCPTGRYNGVPFNDARKRMQDWGDPSAWPTLVPEIIGKGVPMAGDPMPSPSIDFPGNLTGPSSQPGPVRVTETVPPGGGAPVTSTQNTTINYTYVGGNTINVTTTNTTNNPGGGTTTVTEPKEIKLCGVPGNPPCKMDETGTPTTVEDPSQKIKDALKDPTSVAKDPDSFFPKFPELNWSFQLPTGCSSIPLPAFAPFFDSIDLCPFKPVFHDLMTVVWLVGGIFGAIQLFLRDALAS